MVGGKVSHFYYKWLSGEGKNYLSGNVLELGKPEWTYITLIYMHECRNINMYICRG